MTPMRICNYTYAWLIKKQHRQALSSLEYSIAAQLQGFYLKNCVKKRENGKNLPGKKSQEVKIE